MVYGSVQESQAFQGAQFALLRPVHASCGGWGTPRMRFVSAPCRPPSKVGKAVIHNLSKTPSQRGFGPTARPHELADRGMSLQMGVGPFPLDSPAGRGPFLRMSDAFAASCCADVVRWMRVRFFSAGRCPSSAFQLGEPPLIISPFETMVSLSIV